MLTKVRSRPGKASDARIAIVASQYNALYVDAMLSAAKLVLKRARVKHIRVIRVPGAYEIPVVAARLARIASGGSLSETIHHSPFTIHSPVSAIICLGVILRGETTHAAHIGEAVSRALMDVQVRYEVPVIHEVLLLENEDQARVRCLGRKHNRGAEAAQTALTMARVLKTISKDSR